MIKQKHNIKVDLLNTNGMNDKIYLLYENPHNSDKDEKFAINTKQSLPKETIKRWAKTKFKLKAPIEGEKCRLN